MVKFIAGLLVAGLVVCAVAYINYTNPDAVCELTRTTQQVRGLVTDVTTPSERANLKARLELRNCPIPGSTNL